MLQPQGGFYSITEYALKMKYGLESASTTEVMLAVVVCVLVAALANANVEDDEGKLMLFVVVVVVVFKGVKCISVRIERPVPQLSSN